MTMLIKANRAMQRSNLTFNGNSVKPMTFELEYAYCLFRTNFLSINFDYMIIESMKNLSKSTFSTKNMK